jgi:hypothetical protein
MLDSTVLISKKFICLVFEKLFVLREQNVNELVCVVMSRMMFLHQRLLLLCCYQPLCSERQACIFIVYCVIQSFCLYL